MGKKLSIEVFVTKTHKYRARVEEPSEDGTSIMRYEVTVGGEAWKSGKGAKHTKEILKRMTKIREKLDKEILGTKKILYSTYGL